jgi:hypothetical protein
LLYAEIEKVGGENLLAGSGEMLEFTVDGMTADFGEGTMGENVTDKEEWAF